MMMRVNVPFATDRVLRNQKEHAWNADGSSAEHELMHAWSLRSFVTARVEGMDGGEKKQSQVVPRRRPTVYS